MCSGTVFLSLALLRRSKESKISPVKSSFRNVSYIVLSREFSRVRYSLHKGKDKNNLLATRQKSNREIDSNVHFNNAT